jgi:hypothetical protein
MMNDLPKRACKQQGGSREIENVLAFHAQTAEAFDRGRRFAAFCAERRIKPYQASPTFRTCPSPPALRNRSVTMDTRDWEQEIEYVIEQSAFGETQRAKTVYRYIGHKKAQKAERYFE